MYVVTEKHEYDAKFGPTEEFDRESKAIERAKEIMVEQDDLGVARVYRFRNGKHDCVFNDGVLPNGCSFRPLTEKECYQPNYIRSLHPVRRNRWYRK